MSAIRAGAAAGAVHLQRDRYTAAELIDTTQAVDRHQAHTHTHTPTLFQPLTVTVYLCCI